MKKIIGFVLVLVLLAGLVGTYFLLKNKVNLPDIPGAKEMPFGFVSDSEPGVWIVYLNDSSHSCQKVNSSYKARVGEKGYPVKADCRDAKLLHEEAFDVCTEQASCEIDLNNCYLTTLSLSTHPSSGEESVYYQCWKEAGSIPFDCSYFRNDPSNNVINIPDENYMGC